MLKIKFFSQQASHMLEFGLVVFVLSILIAGAFDINTALQSYTSLQEGVNKALRCSYTTDGDCVSIPTDDGIRDRLFQVTKFQGTNPDYFVNTYDYNGRASWISIPVYDELPTVTVASRVRYNRNLPSSPDTVIDYWQQTHVLPDVSGAGLDPDFSNFPKDPENFKQFGASQLSNITGTTTQRITLQGDGMHIGNTEEFFFPNPFKKNLNAPCYGSKKNGEVDLEKTCEQNKHSANILIHIKGTVLGAGHGAVILKLKVDGKAAEELGGRLINGGDYAHDDFTTRGLIKTCAKETNKNGEVVEKCSYNATESFTDDYRKEARLYKNLSIPYDTNIKLRFEVVSIDGGEIGWRADEIKIFTSKYKPKQFNQPGAEGKTEPITKNCPANNYGSENLQRDCLALCPVDDPEMIADSAVCEEAEVQRPDLRFEFKPTCGNPTADKWDSGNDLVNYAKVRLTETLKRNEDEFTQDEKPENKYCGIGRIVNRNINERDLNLTNDSIFRGVWPDLGCNWEDILKQSAIHDLPEDLKVDERAYMEFDRILMGEEKVISQPSDQCTIYRTNYKNTGPGEVLGNFPHSTLPAECKEEGVRCKLDFVGFTAGLEAKSTINGQNAINSYGIPLITTTFPAANFAEGCTEGYCSEFKQVDTGDENLVSYSAKMKVPLTLLKALGMDDLELSYTDSHRLEKVYSK